MDTNLTLIFRYIGLTQAVFVIAYLMFFKEKSKTVLFFGLFVLASISPNILHIFISSGLTSKYPRLNFAPLGMYYFAIPFYYLYVRSLFENVKAKKMWLFMIPGIIEVMLESVLFCLPVATSYRFWTQYTWVFTLYFGVLVNAFSIYLLYLNIRQIRRYHAKYLHFFSNTQKINLSWVKYTSYVLLTNHFFQLATIAFLFNQSQKEVIYFIDSILTVMYVYWVSIYGLKQAHIPEEFRNFENAKTPASAPDESDYRTIEEYLSVNKIYKNPNLTVVELAEKLELHPKRVSQAINLYSNKNFNQFINRYRIEEAKKLLADPSNNHITIEAIANEAGFNSKSVFNTLFKAETDQTPKAFKLAVSEK